MRFFGLEITRAKSHQGLLPARPSVWGLVNEPYAGAWQAGVRADPLGKLTSFGAVFACVSRIANDIAKLEPRIVSVDDKGVWTPAKNSPFSIPLNNPNDYQDRIQFFTWWLVSKLLYGNAYALKGRDARGVVNTLYALDPRRVTPYCAPNGDVYYSLGGSDLSKVPQGMIVPSREVIHDRGITLWHPLCGVSPIYACGISATQGLKIQDNSAAFFSNMSRPSGVLTAPGTIPNETADRLKADFEKNFTASKIGRLAVLGDGLTYSPMTIAANDSQLIEQLKWTVEDVARCYSMPLYKIGSGPMPTANNVEALNQQYYSDCLQSYIEAIELCLTRGLEVPNGMAVEFDLDALLRMDKAAQIEMLSKGVGAAIFTPNETRQRLNLGPKTGGDELYLQEQNFSLPALAKRDQKPDPWASAPAPAPAEESASDIAEQAAEKAVADATNKVASALSQIEAQTKEVCGAVIQKADALVGAVREEMAAQEKRILERLPAANDEDEFAKALLRALDAA